MINKIEKIIQFSGVNFEVVAEVSQDPCNDRTWAIEDIKISIEGYEVYDVLGQSVIDYLESEIKDAARLEAEYAK